MQFLDTNVLLYSISRDPKEKTKRDRAVTLLEQDSNALSVQVLQEFYVQATRASRTDALPHEIAVGLIRTWTRFPVQPMTLPIMESALDIKQRYHFSYWDSAIIASAHALGCEILHSEDLQDGFTLKDLTIRNPFL